LALGRYLGRRLAYVAQHFRDRGYGVGRENGTLLQEFDPQSARFSMGHLRHSLRSGDTADFLTGNPILAHKPDMLQVIAEFYQIRFASFKAVEKSVQD